MKFSLLSLAALPLIACTAGADLDTAFAEPSEIDLRLPTHIEMVWAFAPNWDGQDSDGRYTLDNHIGQSLLALYEFDPDGEKIDVDVALKSTGGVPYALEVTVLGRSNRGACGDIPEEPVELPILTYVEMAAHELSAGWTIPADERPVVGVAGVLGLDPGDAEKLGQPLAAAIDCVKPPVAGLFGALTGQDLSTDALVDDALAHDVVGVDPDDLLEDVDAAEVVASGDISGLSFGFAYPDSYGGRVADDESSAGASPGAGGYRGGR